ncbi:MAG: hypothetical protein ABR866_16715 [Candidatus Korobacteraceae bacterium]|jgi:molybdate transport system permease protein
MNLPALWVTLKLAGIVAVLLMIVGLPVAYWLAFSRWRWKFLLDAVVAMPLVLPPTVLGFYLLVAMGRKARSVRGIRDGPGIRWRLPLKDWSSAP